MKQVELKDIPEDTQFVAMWCSGDGSIWSDTFLFVEQELFEWSDEYYEFQPSELEVDTTFEEAIFYI